jgi:hypothetical protein
VHRKASATVSYNSSDTELFHTDWTEEHEDPKNVDLWEVDWDDDSLNDDFSKSLREELSRPPPAQPKG